MAYSDTGLEVVAVGKNVNMYIYATNDTLTSITARFNFNTTNTPYLKAGDIILLSHATQTLFIPLRITAVDQTCASMMATLGRMRTG